MYEDNPEDPVAVIAILDRDRTDLHGTPWLRWSTWRVPVDGSKPTLISSCTR
jgi:hypothetical protein